MPSYQQMIQQMQKTQREFERKQKLLDEKEFEYTANGAVKITLKGNMDFVSIEFLDKDLLNADDEDMLKDMIKIDKRFENSINKVWFVYDTGRRD